MNEVTRMTIYEILFLIAETIALIGLIVLVYGCVKVIIRYLKIELLHHPYKTPLDRLHYARYELGTYIMFTLDFLIISDIIITVAKPSLDELIKLTVIIIVRTMIGFFLSKELEHVEHLRKDAYLSRERTSCTKQMKSQNTRMISKE